MGYEIPEDHHGPRPSDFIEVTSIQGDDDDARLVVGRAVPRQEIAPHPRTGEGDARGVLSDKIEKWDMGDRDPPLVKVVGIESDDSEAPQGVENAVLPGGVNAVSRDNRTLTERVTDSDSVKDIVEILGQGADGGGKRLNAGKNRIELLPPEWLWALADVMTQGSKKYEARNWERGMDWSSMIGCMYRHLAKFQAGERYDGKEFNRKLGTTGCHELAMVAWNALALMVYDLRGVGTNDLPVDDYQLDLFCRVNAATSDLNERIEGDIS